MCIYWSACVSNPLATAWLEEMIRSWQYVKLFHPYSRLQGN
jgi:hypothetical protein